MVAFNLSLSFLSSSSSYVSSLRARITTPTFGSGLGVDDEDGVPGLRVRGRRAGFVLVGSGVVFPPPKKEKDFQSIESALLVLVVSGVRSVEGGEVGGGGEMGSFEPLPLNPKML
jgi:hypothetical protein